jgi:hypothetical protein
VSVPECPANRVGGDVIRNDHAGFWQNNGKFVVLCEEPSGMRKHTLRDVEQINRRRSEQVIGKRQGNERLDGNKSVWYCARASLVQCPQPWGTRLVAKA